MQEEPHPFATTQGESLTPQPYPQSEQTHMININELISEPNKPSPTEYFLSTLFELSLYLFRKKNESAQNPNEISFDQYLNSVSKEIDTYDASHRKAKLMASQVKADQQQSSHELLQCYQRVPYAFFKQNFILDFGQLAKNRGEIKSTQEKLNDDLDLVEINLFTQIHNKFHEYFKVVANLDYLNSSLDVNIRKNQEARASIQKVQKGFLEKSYQLKKKITNRQNLEKLLKLTKIIKSLKKLPSIIKQILQSSLPYECLSLLKSTKESLSQVQGLSCLSKTSQTIRESQSLVQMGLNKRYTDELYLYLEECQSVNLQEGWDRINSNNCVDISGLNSSSLGLGILEESILDMHPSTSKNKRNEGKQFQIAMILIESYRYIDFPADLIRIKVTNSLRIFCKRFDNELAECLSRILEDKAEDLLQVKQPGQNQAATSLKLASKASGSEEESALGGVVEKITVIFYMKHLLSFNQIMKDTLDRFLGYLHTLMTEYNEQKVRDEIKFNQLFREELSILPAICKVIIEKLKILIGLKNISGITFAEFRQWISVLEYWKRYTDNLIDDNPLVNLEGENVEIEEAINDTIRKVVGIFNIEPTINELALNFITVFHSNTINQELEPAFVDESWQAIEIPSEFVDVLNNICQWHHEAVPTGGQLTILNESSDMRSLNKSASQDYSVLRRASKFRVLKSNVMVDGVRYKISVSFLLLCEFIEEYVKMNRALPHCRKFMYERMLDLVEYYSSRTKELILEAKARQYEKMKAKNISAKHLCLVHNCLSVLLKLLRELRCDDVKQFLHITVANLQNHRKMIIFKLSFLLKSKVDSTIANFLINKQQKVSQVNLALLNVFVQMMGIIDEYLELEEKRAVFKEPIDIFISKYFKELLLAGNEHATENKLLVEKLRFLRQYFPEELELLERQVRNQAPEPG